MIKFIRNISTTTEATIQLLEGKYSGLLLRVSGTGTSSVPRPTGRVLVNLEGEGNIVNIPFKHLVDITNILWGAPEDSPGISFAFSAILPFSLPYMSNVLDLSPNEAELVIPAVPGATSATWEIYGILSEMAENFIMKIDSRTIAMTGGTKEPMAIENAVGLYITIDSNATAPTRLAIFKDENLFVEADWDVLVSFTNIISEVETPLTNKIWIDLNPTKILSTSLCDNITIQETGGSGNLQVVSFGIHFKPERQQISMQKTTAQISSKIEKKITKVPSLAIHPGLKSELGGGEI
jgi:hypothetical protein